MPSLLVITKGEDKASGDSAGEGGREGILIFTWLIPSGQDEQGACGREGVQWAEVQMLIFF